MWSELLLVAMLGCGVKAGPVDTSESDTDTDTDTDSDTDSDTDTDTDVDTIPYEDVCGIHFSEAWAFYGECPRMKTPCELTVSDAPTCAFDIAYSSGMTMGMPYTMVITGTSVTFGDGDSIEGCTGTIVDGDTITGTCASGCTFELLRETEG